MYVDITKAGIYLSVCLCINHENGVIKLLCTLCLWLSQKLPMTTLNDAESMSLSRDIDSAQQTLITDSLQVSLITLHHDTSLITQLYFFAAVIFLIVRVYASANFIKLTVIPRYYSILIGNRSLQPSACCSDESA